MGNAPRSTRYGWVSLSLLILCLPGCHSRTAVQPVAASHPSPADLHLRQGVLAARKGDWQGALEEWQTAVQFDRTKPDAYLRIAEVYARQGKMHDAVNELEALRSANPRAREIDCREAALYMQGNQVERATGAALRSVRTDPGCALGHSILGISFDLAGRNEAAVRELEEAHRLTPADEAITLQLIQILGRSGNSARAQQLLTPLLARPRFPVQAQFLMASLLAGPPAGDTRAMPYLRQALDRDRLHAGSNALYGEILARRGEYVQARGYLERAWQNGAGDPDLLSALALVWGHVGETDAARARQLAGALRAFQHELQRARSYHLDHPDDRANNLKLAQLEARNRDSSDAVDLVRAILTRNPNDRDALALLDRLVIPPKRVEPGLKPGAVPGKPGPVASPAGAAASHP